MRHPEKDVAVTRRSPRHSTPSLRPDHSARTILLLYLGSLLLGMASCSSLTEHWYGGKSNERALSIVETSDGGFLLAGETSSFGAGRVDMFLVRVDQSGRTVWTKTLGGPGDDRASMVRTTHDGKFVVVGTTYSLGPISQLWVVKISDTGNQEWEIFQGTAPDLYGRAIAQVDDDGFVVSCDNGGSHDSRVYLAWLNRVGKLESIHPVESAIARRATSVIPEPSGGVILAGEARRDGSPVPTAYLAKLRPNGTIVWELLYHGMRTASAARLTSDGGYVLAGGRIVIKTDEDGKEQWRSTVALEGAASGFNDVIQSGDGGYLAVGHRSPIERGAQTDIAVVKLDNHGTMLWDKTIGGTKDDVGYAILETSAGIAVVAGFTRSIGLHEDNVYLAFVPVG